MTREESSNLLIGVHEVGGKVWDLSDGGVNLVEKAGFVERRG